MSESKMCLVCRGKGQVFAATEIVPAMAVPESVLKTCEECGGTGRTPDDADI